MLDPAIWRRFDAVIEFALPTESQRSSLLERLFRDVKVQGSLKAAAAAGKALSFAELERVARTALKTMVIEDRKSVSAASLTKDIRQYRDNQYKARRPTGRDNER
jgi:AAA+ superfamily predicted ATPase